jgi:hypothetical protein
MPPFYRGSIPDVYPGGGIYNAANGTTWRNMNSYMRGERTAVSHWPYGPLPPAQPLELLFGGAGPVHVPHHAHQLAPPPAPLYGNPFMNLGPPAPVGNRFVVLPNGRVQNTHTRNTYPSMNTAIRSAANQIAHAMHPFGSQLQRNIARHQAIRNLMNAQIPYPYAFVPQHAQQLAPPPVPHGQFFGQPPQPPAPPQLRRARSGPLPHVTMTRGTPNGQNIISYENLQNIAYGLRSGTAQHYLNPSTLAQLIRLGQLSNQNAIPAINQLLLTGSAGNSIINSTTGQPVRNPMTRQPITKNSVIKTRITLVEPVTVNQNSTTVAPPPAPNAPAPMSMANMRAARLRHFNRR